MTQTMYLLPPFLLPLLLLILPLLLHGELINCSTYSSPLTYEARSQRAWQACLEDTECSDMYDQRRRSSYDVFSLLARRIVDAYDPVRDIYCAGGGADESAIWQLYLKGALKSESICDINHHHVIDEDGLSSHCACDPDKQCGPSGTNLTVVVVLFILIAVGLIVIAFTSVFKIYAGLRAYDKWLRLTAEEQGGSGGGKSSARELQRRRHELFKNTL